MSNVHTKLMKARLALQGKTLKKSGKNTFAGYQYFELGDFLPAVQEIFSSLGLCGIVSYSADIAKLTITDTEGGSSVEITSPMGSAALKGCHEVQNIGAVETYQRRYLWVAAMEIVEHDVLDATTGSDKTKTAGMPEGDLANHKAAIEATANLDDLKTAYTKAYKAALAIGDQAAQESIRQAYEKRKGALTPQRKAA